MEAKRLGTISAEPPPIGERGFKQRVGSDDIRINEVGGAVDRAIDMRFRPPDA